MFLCLDVVGLFLVHCRSLPDTRSVGDSFCGFAMESAAACHICYNSHMPSGYRAAALL